MGETVGDGKIQTKKTSGGSTIEKKYEISLNGNNVSPGCVEQLLDEFKKIAKDKCNIVFKWQRVS